VVRAIAYADASALTKLALDEPGSVEMRHWYRENERVVCSRIGIVETLRALARQPHDPVHATAILDTVEVFELDADIAASAIALGPPALRTLDAIHVATALALTGIDAFVTYDLRQAEAARSVGLPVVSPA
jgi:hypothetical protein